MFEISGETLQRIADYLANKPFKEVHELMRLLTLAKPVEAKPVEAKPEVKTK